MERLREAKEMGVSVKKKWLATNDPRTRDTHRELDGQERDVDEPFQVDGMKIDYPGDPTAPPELTYNCRCTLVYVYGKNGAGNIKDDEKQKPILKNNEQRGIIHSDSTLLHTVGAASPHNPNVINPETGLSFEFVKGRAPMIPTDHTMAGFKCKTGRQIDDIDRLVQTYNASAEKWQKEKARYWVYDTD